MDTFLVQVWVPADGSLAVADLRGVVRHVATGVETTFCGDEEVLQVLHGATGDSSPSPAGLAPGLRRCT